MRKALIAFAAAFFALNDLSSAAVAQEKRDPAQELARIAKKFDMGSVWLRAERDDGRVLLEMKVGNVDLTRPVQIAGVSQAVTGIAVALLIQDGKLSLDTTLGETLSAYFATRGKPLDPTLKDITIRRLLTHTAGLPRGTPEEDGIRTALVRELWPTDDRWDYLIAADADKSDGAARFAQSGASYLLLAMVIEQVSGESYQAFTQSRVFKPLGVTTAEESLLTRVFSGAHGWSLSLPDLLRLWRAFEPERAPILTAATLQSLFLTPLAPPISNGRHYALGAFVNLNVNGRAYAATQSGSYDYYHVASRFTFVEKVWPGHSWVMVSSRRPKNPANGAPPASAEIRSVVLSAFPPGPKKD